jgi:acetyl esterase
LPDPSSFAPAVEVRRNIEYGRADGQSLQLDALLPVGAGPFPAAIVVHGGGWVTGDRRWTVEPLFAPLIEAGFACLSISYRLATQAAMFGAAVEDVEMAVRYVRAHAAEFRIDAGKIALVAESAGGQLAAMAVLGKSEAVKAVVLLYAPTDLERIAAAQGLVLTQLRKLSPIHHVRAGMPPFLLIHGTADALVPFEQSREMCKAVRKTGSRCDLIAVNGGSHGLRRWESAGLTGYKRLMGRWLCEQIA